MIDRRSDGSYQLHLMGFAVSQIIIDFAFRLQLAGPDNHGALLKIEGHFGAVLAGTTQTFQPGDDTPGLEPALTWFQRVIDGASIATGGELRMTFEGADTLWVPSDPKYEAWSINERGGVLIIDGPSGLISVFPPAVP